MMTTTPNRLPCIVRCVLAALLGAWLIVAAHSAEESKRNYELSAGDAATTLRMFSEASGCEILFAAEIVRGVRTSAVQGEFTAQSALDRMLAATNLHALQDPRTGAFAVRLRPEAASSRPAAESTLPSQSPSAVPPNSMNRKNPVAILLAWLGFGLLSAEPAVSAERTAASSAVQQVGTVTGYVSNQVTGDMLEAATVQVDGTNINTRSERGGGFTLLVPVGTHTIVVSYAGLDTLRLPVTVQENQKTRLDVPLKSNIYMLDKYTVSGIREGEARSLELQRQAENLKTIVASDAFGTAEAATPAVLLMRLPGVSGHDISGGGIFLRGLDQSFVSLKIDGNDLATSGLSMSRSVVIDFSIPTDNVESVELIRAATPDMPSNAVAGQINLITRRGIDMPGRRVNLALGTTWTDLIANPDPFRDRPALDFINFNFSDTYNVLRGRNNLSVLFNVSRRNFALVADQAAGTLAAGAGAAYVFPTATNGLTTPLRRAHGSAYNWVYRPLYGSALNLDFKPSDRTYLYLKNTINFNGPAPGGTSLAANFAQATSTGTTADAFEPGSTYDLQRAKPLASSKNEVQTFRSDLRFRTYAHSAGIEHKLLNGSGLLSLDANYSYALNWRPLNAIVKAEVTGIGWELDRRGQPDWLPKFTQTAGPSIYDPNNYIPTLITRTTNYSPAERYGLRLDFRKNAALTVPAYFKVGVKLDRNNGEQDANTANYTYTGPRGIAPYSQFRFVAARGRYGPFSYLTIPGTGGPADLTDVVANKAVLTQTAADAYNSVNSTFANDARFKETINAAYAMGGVTIGMLRVLGGLRVEETENESTAYRRVTSVSAGTTSIATLPPEQNAARALKQFANGMSTTTGDYRNVFPGLHFIIEPMRKLQFRATYNTSITRPAISNLLPISTINDDAQLVTTGNPELRPFTTDNFELAMQKYFVPAGLFEVSAFLKQIKNYTRTIDSFVPTGTDNGFNGQYAAYTLRQVRNTGGARIRGIEVSYQQQYTSLPGFLRGLGSFANFSYTQGEGDFGSTTFTRSLPNLRPRVANAGISYVGYGAEVRVIGNWMSKYYISGVGNTLVENEAVYKFDFKSQYHLNRRFTLYFDIENFANDPTNAQIAASSLKYYAKWQGAIYAAGVKVNF